MNFSSIRSTAATRTIAAATATLAAAGSAIAITGTANAGTVPLVNDDNPTVVMTIHNDTDATMYQDGADLHDATIVSNPVPIAPHSDGSLLIHSDDGIGAWGTVGYHLAGDDGYAGAATLAFGNDGATADADGTIGWNGINVGWMTTTDAPYAHIDYNILPN